MTAQTRSSSSGRSIRKEVLSLFRTSKPMDVGGSESSRAALFSHAIDSPGHVAIAGDREPAFDPCRLIEVEISQPLPVVSLTDEITGRSYGRALCLVRLHGSPLGVVEL